MQVNSVNNVSFKGVRVFETAKAAKRMLNTGRDVLINLEEHKLSSTPKFLVATGEDASIAREAQRNITGGFINKAKEILNSLAAKAERTGEGKYTDVI